MRSVVSRGAFVLATLLAVTPRDARALDLQGALREVAAANPTLASRRESVEAARRRVNPAGAWQSPMVDVGVINVPTSGRFDQDPMTMKMIGIEQRVPLFGANGMSRQSAGAAADAEGAGWEMAHYEFFAMAWEAYADAYYAGQLAGLSQGHRGEMDRLVRSARARYDSGNGRLDDLLRAEAEQARTLADAAAFDSETEGARARLAALMGRPGAALPDTLEPPPTPMPPADPAAILAVMNDQHPRLRELRFQRDRYQLAARAARRTEWPDLQLGASYGFREPIMGVPQQNMWSATVGFMLPIFAGSTQEPEAAEMDAMARAAEAELSAAILELSQQARGLHATARADARTVALLADTVVVTQRRAVEASQSAYDAGVSDLWRVFEAEHALYGEEIALIRARQDLARTTAKLLAVTARGDLLGVTLPEIKRSER
ncbi:MAG: TolC family protein [Candidatus Eisenbacteria bacterium]